MIQQVKTKVPFTLEVATNCLCGNCPVQKDSKCSASLNENWDAASKRQTLKHEEIAGAYCGAGAATCSDLDPNKSCICAGCPVFAQYNLMSGTPLLYYCTNGVAH